MPFDGTTFNVLRTNHMWYDWFAWIWPNAKASKHPEMKKLRDRLLDRSSWPEDFQWDFSDYDRCAMALITDHDDVVSETQRILRIDNNTTNHLFGAGPAIRRNIHISDVTPEMVAADIDDWLQKNS